MFFSTGQLYYRQFKDFYYKRHKHKDSPRRARRKMTTNHVNKKNSRGGAEKWA